jgi:hypothetical protein
VHFEILTWPTSVELIAAGPGIRERRRLVRRYGRGRWRKLEGWAIVRLPGARLCWAEIHWYEAHGLGRKEPRIKRILRELA